METSMNKTSTEEQFDLEQALSSGSALAPNEFSIVRVEDTLICSGSVPMFVPPKAIHVRLVELRLPLFAGKPSVNATLYSTESVGTLFNIYNIRVNDLPNQTQVAIAAVNLKGAVDVPFPQFCDFVVIGKAA